MAARRALDWIGMFEGPDGFLDQTCSLNCNSKSVNMYSIIDLMGRGKSLRHSLTCVSNIGWSHSQTLGVLECDYSIGI